MRDDLGRNEREALLMTHRNDNDVLLTVWAGVALVTGGCAFWIVAAVAVTQLGNLLGGH